MRRRASVLLHAFVLASLLAGAVHAYHGKPGRAGVLAEGPVQLSGDLLASAQPASALYVSGGDLDLALVEGTVEGTVTEVRVRGGPLSGVLPPPDPVTSEVAAAAPDFALSSVGHAMNLLVFTHGGLAQFRYASSSAVVDREEPGRIAPTPAAWSAGLSLAADRKAGFEHAAPGREVGLDARGGVLEALGDFRIFVYDATVQVGTDSVRTGSWADGSDKIVRYAVFVLRGANLRISDEGSLASFRAPVLDLALNGTASFGAARGSAAVASDDPNLAGDVATMSGVLAITAVPTDGGVRLDAAGDFVAVTIDGVESSFLQPAAVGLLAAGAAALVLLWPAAKTSGAAALYARFGGAEVLDHAARERALAFVRARPGASVKDVAVGLGVSWSTSAYHLEVLAREGFLARHAAGRHRRYFVVGDATDRDATSILHDATARRLADLVAGRPGISQKELAAAAGISASTASWQLKRLVASGVLRETRAWRRVSYVPGEVTPGPTAPRPPPRGS